MYFTLVDLEQKEDKIKVYNTCNANHLKLIKPEMENMSCSLYLPFWG